MNILQGVEEVLPEEEFQQRWQKNKQLRVKFGADPTAPDLHLGHTVVLRKLRQFQEQGHTVVFLIGDFTAMIGDPSGRIATRPPLTREEIMRNAETYQQQVFKILLKEKTEVVFNSSWLQKMDFAAVIRLAAQYNVARLLEREDFRNRLSKGTPVSVHELLYPLIQGYDSVEVRADVEIGGTDQKFNLLVGRELQKHAGQEPQLVMTMPLLEGLDGVKKMSKSYGNYIALEDPPREMVGKIMSISDELMYRYYLLLTDHSENEIKKMRDDAAKGKAHPRDLKLQLAEEIATFYHGAPTAKAARQAFIEQFSKGKLPDEIPEYQVLPEDLKEGKVWIVRVLCQAGITKSNGEARRLLAGGGVSLNGEKIANAEFEWTPAAGDLLKAGKRQYRRLQM